MVPKKTIIIKGKGRRKNGEKRGGAHWTGTKLPVDLLIRSDDGYGVMQWHGIRPKPKCFKHRKIGPVTIRHSHHQPDTRLVYPRGPKLNICINLTHQGFQMNFLHRVSENGEHSPSKYWYRCQSQVGNYTSSFFFFGSRTGGSTSIPMLAAVPAIILIADSMVVQFRSGSFSAAIVRNWSMVTFPTFSCFGSFEPFSTPKIPHNINQTALLFSIDTDTFSHVCSINHNLILTHSSLSTSCLCM